MGANSEQLRRMLEIVAAFSESIGMEMGLDKCAVLDVRRGKIQDREEGATLMNNITNDTCPGKGYSVQIFWDKAST